MAGACIAFYSKHPVYNDWHPVVRSDSPAKLGPEGALGIEALCGGGNGGTRPARIASAGWTMRERDPTSVTVHTIGGLREHLVTIRCDARALEMRVEGTSFAGFRVHMPPRTRAKDPEWWQVVRPGQLKFEHADRQFTIEHSPALDSVTDAKSWNRGRALRMNFMLTGRQAPAEPLSIHISDATFATLADDPTAPGGG